MTPKTLEGQTLGKYRVLEPLGQGGMAQVYRAYHPSLDRYVAIKMLRSDLVEEEEFLARFSREARSVAALRHPNIVQVFDFDMQDGQYYMVMELLEGDTLKSYLNRFRAKGERISCSDIVRILSDVLKGLAYAHSEGIIHRDIKPANIMLTRRGEAVITDFGIAQIVGGTKYTMAGALMGTLHYMAPEQGISKNVDARSDIYSLGVVLYEMLTGNPPFDADTPLAILMKHLNDPLPLPSEPGKIMPKVFERIVLKAMAKQPEDRYQTADEMMAVLMEAGAVCGGSSQAAPDEAMTNLGFGPAGEAVPGEALVYSGTDRNHITDRNFAADDTDASLGQHLRNSERDSEHDRERGYSQAGISAPAAAEGTLNDVLRAAGNLFTSVGGVVTGALNEAAENVRQSTENVRQSTESVRQSTDGVRSSAARQESQAGLLEAVETGQGMELADGAGVRGLSQPSAARSALIGVGLLIGANLLAVAVGTTTQWWGLFEFGWPAELLLVAILLSLVMGAIRNIWMLIPVGLLAGNGLILAYCSLTGNWGAWGFLWLFEVLLLGGVISLSSYLARKYPDSGRALAHALGLPVAIGSGLVLAFIGFGSLVASVLHRLFR